MQRIPVYRLMGPEKVKVGEALVDDEDYELVADREWFVATRYASSRGELMHRVIIGAQPGEHVHHRNGERLDNRRENLELLEPGEHKRRYHPRPRLPRFRADGSISE